jgi:2,4-dienoyl-CoA reductase-like NADH-dependent reductase (Old Yellow Enzyme family)
MPEKSAIDIIAQPLDLPCGLTLPNRLVKCPMQETLAQGPYFDPPIDTFKNLYTKWATSSYGLLITGQVQVDRRFLSIAGDVCTHERSLEPDVLNKWKQWAKIAQQDGTPCIVQLAHPGRMSPAGAGIRPRDMAALCPSSVPVVLGDSWLDKVAQDNLLGTPKAMTLQDIDEVVAMFVHAAIVARDAGFAGSQIHGAHGFLLSQFLSPHTNRRTDDYGGTAEKRLKLLQRMVIEIREVCPRPYCLSVKLNSADYMDHGIGLEQDEGLEQVRWLVECGMVDFVEISGGNAETKTSGLHTSFGKKTMDKAPTRSESTRIREGFFTEFAEKVQGLNSPIPIQLSGGFRSRTGMADAIDSGICELVGLGRAAVLEPELPRKLLLNPDYDDSLAFGMSHQVRGLWFGKMFPAKIIGGSFGIKFFYYNMRRLGHGMSSDPDASVPWIVGVGIWETLSSGVMQTMQRILGTLTAGGRVKTE